MTDGGYRLFEQTKVGHVTKQVWVNDRGDVTHKRSEDVAPVLEANKLLANSYGGERAGEHMVRAASVPMAIYLKWLDEGVDMLDPNCADEVDRRLNSSEWAFLRTDPRRL